MNLVAMDKKCEICEVKLTDFEIKEEFSLCLDCFEEKYLNESSEISQK